MDSTFEKFEIVQYLQHNEGSFYETIKQLYTICQNLLLEIPKFFSNYTIHDIGHSVRVIGYMNDLVKNRLEQFSGLHLMMIICVGLLHDIGMVVLDDEVENLYQEFETKNFRFKNLSDKEKHTYLQDYVRKKHGERVLSMLNSSINNDTKMKSLLYVGDTKSYDLSEIIALICQSHTKDIDWIEANLDQERIYGNYVINPQQIALLLRIGDALDIDDRRAPYVLYKLLNPQGISDNEWRKHIPITNYDKICFKGNKYIIVFSGECCEPEIYRKILEYTDWLQLDLKYAEALCTKFKDNYRLNVCDTIQVSIKLKGFVASHLTFNLEYKQISKLLMGEKIYGNKKDGLRELLQNAIDAVLLMHDIEKGNPYSDYSPIVGIEIDEEKRQLIVFDNGVGMSIRILQNYFFNIGNSYYVSDEFIAGEHAYHPIGHFGIGFLACFMLSSKVRLETRHYKAHEAILMDFERDSSYVTRLDGGSRYPLDHGTRIILDYDQIIPEIFPDSQSVYSYLKDLLVANDYKMLFIHNDREEVLLPTLDKVDSHDGEDITFSYSISRYLSVKFDMLNLFEDDECVYIVDELPNDNELIYGRDFFGLGHFSDIVSEIERAYQTRELDWDEALLDLPVFFYQWLDDDAFDPDYPDKGKNIRALFDRYMNSFIQNSTLTWYELPVVRNEDALSGFLDMVKEDGVGKALIHYKSDIEWISVLSRESLSKQAFLQIMKTHMEMSFKTKAIVDYGYILGYPVDPLKKTTQFIELPDTNFYLRIVPNVQIPKSKVYLKGIFVEKESIMLPYAIAGINIEHAFLNICSDSYSTDVARSSFDTPSKKKLAAKAAQLIYKDIMQNANLDWIEKSLIERFIDAYYS